MIDTAAQPFAPGDIVRLKSGSPFLTVTGYEETFIEVIWIDDGGALHSYTAPDVCFYAASTPAQNAAAAS